MPDLLSATTPRWSSGEGAGSPRRLASVNVTVYEFKVVRVVTTSEDSLEEQLNAYGERGFAVVGVAEYSGQSMIILQRVVTPEPEKQRPTQRRAVLARRRSEQGP